MLLRLPMCARFSHTIATLDALSSYKHNVFVVLSIHGHAEIGAVLPLKSSFAVRHSSSIFSRYPLTSTSSPLSSLILNVITISMHGLARERETERNGTSDKKRRLEKCSCNVRFRFLFLFCASHYRYCVPFLSCFRMQFLRYSVRATCSGTSTHIHTNTNACGIHMSGWICSFHIYARLILMENILCCKCAMRSDEQA